MPKRSAFDPVNPAAEAMETRDRFRKAIEAILARLPDLDKHGMSVGVRSRAQAAGIPLDELHPFDHGITGTRPICELDDEEVAKTKKAKRGRRRSVQ